MGGHMMAMVVAPNGQNVAVEVIVREEEREVFVGFPPGSGAGFLVRPDGSGASVAMQGAEPVEVKMVGPVLCTVAEAAGLRFDGPHVPDRMRALLKPHGVG